VLDNLNTQMMAQTPLLVVDCSVTNPWLMEALATDLRLAAQTSSVEVWQA
jgi:hypothetical protein